MEYWWRYICPDCQHSSWFEIGKIYNPTHPEGVVCWHCDSKHEMDWAASDDPEFKEGENLVSEKKYKKRPDRQRPRF